MKKALIFILLLGLSVFTYLKWRSGNSSPGQMKAIPSQALEKIKGPQERVFSRFLKKEELDSKAYKVFVNPMTKSEFYLKEANLTAKEGKEFLKKAFDGLKECAKEGCGQGPDQDGFFDAAHTVSMVSMKRILESALLEPDSLEAKEWLKEEDLLGLLDAPNSKVRKLALKNLMNLHPTKRAMEEVLTKSNELSGYEAGDLIEGLIPHVNEENKDALIDGMITMIGGEDMLTTTDVLMKAEELKVNRSQLERIAKELCSFKGDKAQESNFKAMNYSMNVMAKNSKISFDLSTYCR